MSVSVSWTSVPRSGKKSERQRHERSRISVLPAVK